MYFWRQHLNRLATEFWFGIGCLGELPEWADAANTEMGEVHPHVWDLYTTHDPERAKNILLEIAKLVNGFVPESWEALPLAAIAFRKALASFTGGTMPVQSMCALVTMLDNTYNVGLDSALAPESLGPVEFGFLGDLWNCCDWCDESWTHENSPHLLAEAQRVSEMLANQAFEADGYAAAQFSR